MTEDFENEDIWNDRPRVSYEGLVPKCTDKKTFIAWLEQAEIAKPPPRFKFCYDCTREYQQEMIKAKRCENPNVVFVKDRDGLLCGVLRD